MHLCRASREEQQDFFSSLAQARASYGSSKHREEVYKNLEEKREDKMKVAVLCPALSWRQAKELERLKRDVDNQTHVVTPKSYRLSIGHFSIHTSVAVLKLSKDPKNRLSHTWGERQRRGNEKLFDFLDDSTVELYIEAETQKAVKLAAGSVRISRNESLVWAGEYSLSRRSAAPLIWQAFLKFVRHVTSSPCQEK